MLTQVLFAGAVLCSWLLLPENRQRNVVADVLHKSRPLDVRIEGTEPIHIAPLYDDPEVVSDEELADVLKKVLPRFSRQQLKPNYAEHALRIWGDQIEFRNPEILSGPELRDFLCDTARYVKSWGAAGEPILQPVDDGVAIRWISEQAASVHHDHLLASLTEAGVSLDTPVYTPGRTMQFRDVLNQALRDFRLDERETEWSVMAFGFWLAPRQVSSWHNGEGREISFDMLAARLLRNHRKHGVCLGTHRVYSMMVLLRLHAEYGGKLLSEETQVHILRYLEDVRDLISQGQSSDGSWAPNWTDGADAESRKDPKEKKKSRVISTGHHLEWLSIAPLSLHPDRQQIRRAADWAINNVRQTPQSEITANYTFYSHIGNALALWRKTTPAAFWVRWRELHPEAEVFEREPAGVTPPTPADAAAAH